MSCTCKNPLHRTTTLQSSYLMNAYEVSSNYGGRYNAPYDKPHRSILISLGNSVNVKLKDIQSDNMLFNIA